MKLFKTQVSQNTEHHKALWQNFAFLVFWGGQALSNLGDSFALVALPLLVLEATGSVTQLGLVTATSGVSQFLAGMIAGSIVDRVDRKKFMIFCNGTRLILYGSIPCVWFLAGPQPWLIYIVAALGASIGMGFQVSYMTVVANIVEADQLTAANSMLQITLSLAYVFGPLLAGIVIAQLGPTTALGVDALSFGISVFSLTRIQFRASSTTRSAAPVSREKEPAQERSRVRAAGLRKQRLLPLEPQYVPSLAAVHVQASPLKRIFSELQVGFRYLWHHPKLRAVTLLRTGASVVLLTRGVGGTLDLFIFHMVHDLHQRPTTVGWVLGITSIGGMVAALLAPALRRRLGVGLCCQGAVAIAGLATIGVGLAQATAIVALSGILFTFGSTLLTIYALSLRQEHSPDELLGRVSAVGAILITRLATHLGASWSLSLAGGWAVGLSVLTLFTTGHQPSRALKVSSKD